MSMMDPLADMYTRIRNASRVKKETVDIPASNLKKEIAKILKEEGFVENFKVLDDDKQGTIRIKLKYDGKKRTSVISGIKQVSKPGLRIYVNSNEVPKVLGGYGIAVLTTSSGVITDAQCRKLRVGGEVLCQVW
jgi:small subunit ribosomal protein S8